MTADEFALRASIELNRAIREFLEGKISKTEFERQRQQIEDATEIFEQVGLGQKEKAC